jgi:uncharacterized protein (TIGR03067 family)
MQPDLEQLQGRWQIVTLEVEGQQFSKDTFDGAKIVIDGDNFATMGMGRTYSGKVSLDETSHPKTIDMTFVDGPHAGKTSFGLYMIDKDQWTICLGFAGSDRPVGFHTAPGSGHALESLRREVTGTSS